MPTKDKPIWNTGLVNNGKLEQVYEMVAVVRCKDCLEFKYCLHNEYNDPNGYCAWGKKENAEE